MSSFVILLGGSLTMTDRLRRQCAGARLIAADSGMRHAALFDRGAELWVGDFDSTDDELAARLAAWKPGHEQAESGYAWLHQQHVMGADTGADLDFLKGCRGNPVGKDSH